MPRKEPDERGDSHLDREQLFKVRSLRPYSEASLCLGDLLRVDVVHEGPRSPMASLKPSDLEVYDSQVLFKDPRLDRGCFRSGINSVSLISEDS